MSAKRRRFHLPISLALMAALVLAATVASAALIVPTKVIATDGNETLPSANGTWIVWSSNAGHPNRYDAFARPSAGGTRVKLNETGTGGYAGGFDPGTNTVIYQQVDHGSSNLYFYDLDTRQRSLVPGVNSSRWEWAPLVSATYVMYQRDLRVDGVWWTEMRIRDRASGFERLLRKVRSAIVFTFTGSISDSHASWNVCVSRCRAFVGEIETDVAGFTVTPFEIHPDPFKHQSMPVVDEANGAIYYVRGGTTCGANVNIFRTPLTPPYSQLGAKVVDLAPNVDVAYRLSLAPNLTTEMDDLYFARWKCGPGEADIYAARGVAPIAP